MAKVLRFTGSVYLLLLALAIGCASSARLLDELEQPIGPNPLLPSGQIPAVVEDVATSAPADPLPVPPVEVPGPASPAPLPVPPVEVPGPLPVPASSASGGGGGGAATSASGGGGSGAATSASGSGGGGGAGASGGASAGGASLSFFMHDIVGGSGPTSRMVTGLVASAVSNVAFTKPNNNLFPVSGGVPLTSANVNGFLNSNRNNLPLLAGLNGQQPTGFSNAQTSTVIQNAGNNNIVSGGTSLPFVAGGQLPAGAATLQKLMFGSVTVIDDQLSEAHELGSPVLGRAQGFYLASSLDGNSHTMVITLILHGAPGEHHVDDTISIFGVHRTATLVSHVAVIGGTGKFENAQGYATVESLPQVDQHTTDGVDTIMHVNVYLSD